MPLPFSDYREFRKWNHTAVLSLEEQNAYVSESVSVNL